MRRMSESNPEASVLSHCFSAPLFGCNAAVEALTAIYAALHLLKYGSHSGVSEKSGQKFLDAGTAWHL